MGWGQTMESKYLNLLMFSAFIIILLLPLFAEGADRSNYITYKQGIYSVESDDLSNSDTKFYGELLLGHYFSPYFSLEFGAGYFDTEGTFRDSLPNIGSIIGNLEITTASSTLSGKAIYPFRFFPIKKGELFVGAGAGIYFVHADADLSTSSGFGDFSVDGNDITYGYHVELGTNVDITKVVFLGISGKYLKAAEADFDAKAKDAKVEFSADISRFIVTVNIGLRF
jgi:opacity protein-like surface antigen